jgi:hypothetical protein
VDFVQPIEEETPKADKFRPVFLSCNAVTLSDGIQLVIRFYGEADKIHENYDFVHCTNYWTSKTGQVVLRQDALEALLAKELVYIGSKYPVASIIRLRKFIKRGWKINAGQILKILFQVSELNLKDINVLEDQLVGVDVAYFNMLINAMQSRRTDDKDPMSYNYLAELVDRMF